MTVVAPLAPAEPFVVDYDRRNLALYAELLDAEASGQNWRDAAEILLIDANAPGAQQCWQSHLERARWIVGDGLEAAIKAFGRG